MEDIGNKDENGIERLTAEQALEIEGTTIRSLETDPSYIAMVEAGKGSRRHVVPEHVEKKFIRDGNKYYLKNTERSLAFEDKGDSLKAKSADERVIKALVSLAEAREWENIKVKGSKEFRQAIWFEANMRGLPVKGYEPTEIDKQEFRERQIKRETDIILGASKERRTDDKDDSRSRKNNLEEKVIRGKLVKHGEAPFEFNNENKSSYFVQIEGDRGTKTIWGADLPRAINDSGAREGDEIGLKYLGRQPVKVKEPVKDESGKVVGKREKDAHRNTWHAEKTDAQKDKERVLVAAVNGAVEHKIKNPETREAVIDNIIHRIDERYKSGQTLPEVRVFDRKAAPAAPGKDKGNGKTDVSEPSQSIEKDIDR